MGSDAASRCTGCCSAEQELLRLRYVDELTQAQIGRRWGRNQMYVQRLLTKVTAKLRRLLDEYHAV